MFEKNDDDNINLENALTNETSPGIVNENTPIN